MNQNAGPRKIKLKISEFVILCILKKREIIINANPIGTSF
jgi:hypothetical protein